MTKERLKFDLNCPRIMGILNITPDSFSDGGAFVAPQAAVEQARKMVDEGADIIDVGGESTRPGAADVSVQQELDRVIPVVERLSAELNVLVSIDTSKPDVMCAAVDAGASLINDVRALQMPGALEAAANCNAMVCLMHMQGQPRTMQSAPNYQDVVADICAFFNTRLRICEQMGIKRDRLWIDPGFGFGKTMSHNLRLLAELHRFSEIGCPILVGLSRKSMFGQLLGREVNERLVASAVGALLAVQNGAQIVRVHDVQATADALNLHQAIEKTKRE